jgi:hypothetical protein
MLSVQMLININESISEVRGEVRKELIPFWILDFRFWIVKELLHKLFTDPSAFNHFSLLVLNGKLKRRSQTRMKRINYR